MPPRKRPTTTRRFIGKVPLGRALRFTTRHEHVSRYTQRRAHGFLEIPKEVKEYLHARIEAAQKQKKPNKRLESWQRMNEVADALSSYVGRKPTYAQAIGALALNRGISREKLLEQANALHSLNRRAREAKSPILADSNTLALDVVGKDGLKKVSTALRNTRGPVTIPRLVKATGLSRGTVNHALIILESMLFARQLPPRIERGVERYSWVASEHRDRPETKPVANPGYKTMLALKTGPKSLSELAELNLYGRRIGTGRLKLFPTRSALQNLEEQGVITTEDRKRPKSGRFVVFYALTELGQRLLKEQENRDSIHPRLRKVLLGAPIPGLLPRQQRRLQAMTRYIRILQEYKRAPRKKILKMGARQNIAKRYGISPIRVDSIARVRDPPWSRLSYDELLVAYLPVMEWTAPVQAKWFSEYLEANCYVTAHMTPFFCLSLNI